MVEAQNVLNVADFQIWKTIRLGALAGSDAYRDALTKANFAIGPSANDILQHMMTAANLTDVDLVVLSVAELGFEKATNYRNIYARAHELELNLCPAEVGPALRLAYLDQPKGYILNIAMEAVTSAGGPSTFFLENFEDLPGLFGNWGNLTSFADLTSHFVFLRSR